MTIPILRDKYNVFGSIKIYSGYTEKIDNLVFHYDEHIQFPDINIKTYSELGETEKEETIRPEHFGALMTTPYPINISALNAQKIISEWGNIDDCPYITRDNNGNYYLTKIWKKNYSHSYRESCSIWASNPDENSFPDHAVKNFRHTIDKLFKRNCGKIYILYCRQIKKNYNELYVGKPHRLAQYFIHNQSVRDKMNIIKCTNMFIQIRIPDYNGSGNDRYFYFDRNTIYVLYKNFAYETTIESYEEFIKNKIFLKKNNKFCVMM